jgi:hypothetical protein
MRKQVLVKPVLLRGRAIAYSLCFIKGKALVSFGIERGGYRIALNHAQVCARCWNNPKLV